MAFIEIRDLYKVFGRNPLGVVKVLEKGGTKADILHKSKHTVLCRMFRWRLKKGKPL